MVHTQTVSNRRQTTLVVADALHDFLSVHHKFEAFEGRNQERGAGYSQVVARSYQNTLERQGWARIPKYESSSDAAVFFDQELRFIEGERLQCTLRGEFFDFDQKALRASIVLSPYELQTTSLGESVIGVSVHIQGKQVACVWRSPHDSNAETIVLETLHRALANSSSPVGFIELIKARRTEVCVDFFS